MTKLDSLYEFARDNTIDIVQASLLHKKKAMCMFIKPDKVIFLNKAAIETKDEEVSILAEEIGHFETGALYMIRSTYNTPIARSNRIKYEAKAKRWAIKKCLPPQEIEKAFKHVGSNYHAVAEHCNVTVEFLRTAIEYYKTL